MRPKLVKGENLTAAQIKQVKSAFVYRYTVENKPAYPMANAATQTDAEWINDHAFYIRKDGTLASRPNYCEPVYLAD